MLYTDYAHHIDNNHTHVIARVRIRVCQCLPNWSPRELYSMDFNAVISHDPKYTILSTYSLLQK